MCSRPAVFLRHACHTANPSWRDGFILELFATINFRPSLGKNHTGIRRLRAPTWVAFRHELVHQTSALSVSESAGLHCLRSQVPLIWAARLPTAGGSGCVTTMRFEALFQATLTAIHAVIFRKSIWSAAPKGDAAAAADAFGARVQLAIMVLSLAAVLLALTLYQRWRVPSWRRAGCSTSLPTRGSWAARRGPLCSARRPRRCWTARGCCWTE